MRNKKINWKALLPFGLLPVLLAALLLLQYGRVEPVQLLLSGALLSFGYFAALSDLRERLIHNRLIVAMLCGWVLIMVPQLFLQTEQAIMLGLQGIIAFIMAGVVLLLVYLASRKGLGGGDVKFMAAAGLYLGVSGVLGTMLYGSVLAAVTGGVLVLLKKIGTKDPIPLAPFLYVGIILTIFIR